MKSLGGIADVPRHFADWLTAYVQHASVTEAPKEMHFFSGVSAIAGALRRKVWIDMVRFRWYPNFFIVFVAKPGIVSKTTTMNSAMDILREVPGIKFGPKAITWQALIEALANSCEMFEYLGEYHPMSALTLASGELGNLIDPSDSKMIDAYITLWDGERKFDKVTKTSGDDMVEAPWINLIGCTTTSWLAENMPPNSVGGGFTSRCIFLHAERKSKYVPWVDEMVSADDPIIRMQLLQDLEHIATQLTGPFTITKEARDWYRPVYEAHWKHAAEVYSGPMVEGYAARKQTHMCKLAMVLSASERSDLVITLDHLQLAHIMLEGLEAEMPKVFASIGKSEEAISSERLLAFIKQKGKVPYEEAYRTVHAQFPGAKGYEDMLKGLIQSGRVLLVNEGQGMVLKFLRD